MRRNMTISGNKIEGDVGRTCLGEVSEVTPSSRPKRSQLCLQAVHDIAHPRQPSRPSLGGAVLDAFELGSAVVQAASDTPHFMIFMSLFVRTKDHVIDAASLTSCWHFSLAQCFCASVLLPRYISRGPKADSGFLHGLCSANFGSCFCLIVYARPSGALKAVLWVFHCNSDPLAANSTLQRTFRSKNPAQAQTSAYVWVPTHHAS